MSILSTTSLYFASALVINGVKLDGVDDADPKHIVFLLSGDGELLEELEKQWDNKELEGNLREYAEAIREFKLKIHSKRETDG
jgi:hypothetical protein